MKTNLIEVTVSGRTGSGKSEVLEVIYKALRENYGPGAEVVGATCEDAIEEARHTGQTARKKNSVFVLYEQNVTGELRVHG